MPQLPEFLKNQIKADQADRHGCVVGRAYFSAMGIPPVDQDRCVRGQVRHEDRTTWALLVRILTRYRRKGTTEYRYDVMPTAGLRTSDRIGDMARHYRERTTADPNGLPLVLFASAPRAAITMLAVPLQDLPSLTPPYQVVVEYAHGYSVLVATDNPLLLPQDILGIDTEHLRDDLTRRTD